MEKQERRVEETAGQAYWVKTDLGSPATLWMSKSFVYAAPGEIRFGWGEAVALPAMASRLCRRPLLVTGSALRRTGRLEALIESLAAAGLGPALHEGVPPEPTLAALQLAMDACVDAEADAVIAIGGGSVLDIGKAVAALSGNKKTAAEFF